MGPSKFARLDFDLAGTEGSEGPSPTLTFALIVTPDTSEPATCDVRSVGFLDVAPDIR